MRFTFLLLQVLLFASFALAQEKTSVLALFQEGLPPNMPPSSSDAEFPHFSDLVKELSKAVVNVSVEGGGNVEGAQPEQDQDNKLPDPGFKSLGSGFIITKDGHIVTNNHVINHSSQIIVRLLGDKFEYPAKVIGRDAKTDLALIKIEPKSPLPTVYVGDSDQLEVGEWVVAIGNQFQLGQTVTAGIVSAKARKLPYQSAGPYDSFIQTDASINPGSSGGPLFNTKGQVVGINSAIYSPGRQQFGSPGFNIGIGFSIPINLAKGILKQLQVSGKVTRGMLGVLIQPVDTDVAEVLGLEKPSGALVADIMKDTPAVKAGFQKKDVIVNYDNKLVEDHDDLPLMVANTVIGSSVKVEVIRAGKLVTLSATVEELKDSSPEIAKPEKLKPNEVGLIIQNLKEEDAKALGLTSNVGVIVLGVEPDSDAIRSGFFKGDIIEELDGQSVTTVDKLNQIFKELKKGQPVLVAVKRKEGSRFLTFKKR